MKKYKGQADLLLRVLPEVAKEKCFAMYGGTEINLFVRDMPRLSVDIDLTYIPLENRSVSFKNISKALLRIKRNVEKVIAGVRIIHQEESLKLLVSIKGAQIKLEVRKRCIEYVFIHEMCHLIVANHNNKFHKLQDDILPNNKKIKEKLERLMV